MTALLLVAESLTHSGELFLIQRFCNELCLRPRSARILKDVPWWADCALADLIPVFLYDTLTHGKTLPKGERAFRLLTHNRPFRA